MDELSVFNIFYQNSYIECWVYVFLFFTSLAVYIFSLKSYFMLSDYRKWNKLDCNLPLSGLLLWENKVLQKSAIGKSHKNNWWVFRIDFIFKSFVGTQIALLPNAIGHFDCWVVNCYNWQSGHPQLWANEGRTTHCICIGWNQSFGGHLLPREIHLHYQVSKHYYFIGTSRGRIHSLKIRQWA